MQSSFSLKKPNISKDLAIDIAEKHFGLESKLFAVKEFDSYSDKNFYFKRKSDQDQNEDNEFVLKILNNVDSAIEGMVEAQNGAMLFLKNQGLICPVPVLSASGSYIIYHDCSQPEMTQVRRDKGGDKRNAVRLMRYVPGDILKNVAVLTEDFLFNFGKYIGKLDKVLKDYSHPGLNDEVCYNWDLVHLSSIKPYISAKYLGTKDRENLVMNVYDQYFATVPQVLQKCSKQVIHNDINEFNVIVTQDTDVTTDVKWRTVGVIDFGDVCYSYRVFEIAIAMAQIITLNYCRGDPKPLESAGKVLKGYQSVYPLSTEELAIIYWCIAGRYIQLLTIGSFRCSIEPENKEYIMATDIHIWKVLPEYLRVNPIELLDKWMNDGTEI
ncbi:hydroxylysine kinase-like [Actinia tenebrosa]|uniref:Hydroxylysine kinase n=1 Tax=Actinia tenebrosa TaxID=6105 RepID=A0A6P8HV24_ACTTE|nr:hydroxylysine kinase-like [Actinia tenebrosa]